MLSLKTGRGKCGGAVEGGVGGVETMHPRCQVDTSGVAIDLKIPTRLPGVAIYIPSLNLLTCRCLQTQGKPPV